MNDLSPEQIQAMIGMLQNMLANTTSSANETDKVAEAGGANSNKAIKTRGRSKINTENNNLFDAMPEINMHKDDVEIDKKLSKFPPAARFRQFEPVNVTCRVCGRQESINPRLLISEPDRYKCNRCSSSAG